MKALLPFPDFEEIPHKADAALIIYGLSLPEIFSHAVLGMYHIMGIIGKNQRKVEDCIVLQASDPETMLVTFLTELLFLAETGIKVEVFELKMNRNILNAKIYKTPVSSIAKEIKAVTFNEMRIIKKDDVYQTKIVFDI